MVIDHFYPYRLERRKALANYRCACKYCNSIKLGHEFGSLKAARYYINSIRKSRGMYFIECGPEVAIIFTSVSKLKE